MMTFVNSLRLEKVAALFQTFFPDIEVSTYRTGLRLVNSEDNSIPCDLMKIKANNLIYVVKTLISFSEDDSSCCFLSIEDYNPDVIPISLIENCPLLTIICDNSGSCQLDFEETVTKLFQDIRYGSFKVGEQSFNYHLPQVNAYQINQIENCFELFREGSSLFLKDDKISLPKFEEYALKELNWLVKKYKEYFFDQKSLSEWQFSFESTQIENTKEYFLQINKFLDMKTAGRLSELTDDPDSLQKLVELTTETPFLVGAFAILFTNDLVIISAPVRYGEGEIIAIDMNQLASSYLVGRGGFLPKMYTLLSFNECIADIFSWVSQVIIRDADMDSVDDIGAAF